MVASCRLEPDPCCYHYIVLQSLFRNEEGTGGGEAGDYWPGLISFLVMFFHCRLPFLRSREGLRDGTRQRKNKHLLGTFQMTGQGPALRATRKGTCLLTFASEVTSGPQGQEQSAPGSSSVSQLGGRAGRASCRQGRSFSLPRCCVHCLHTWHCHLLH